MVECQLTPESKIMFEHFIDTETKRLVAAANKMLSKQSDIAITTDQIVVTLNSSREFNCSLDQIEFSSQININIGLISILQEMIHVFFYRIDFRSTEENQPKVGSAFSKEKQAEMARILMEAFWNIEIPNRKSILEYPPEQGGQKSLATLFRLNSLRFVLAHEFGHLVSNLSDNKIFTKKHAISYMCGILKLDSELVETFGEERIDEWKIELAADALGLELCLVDTDEGIIKQMQIASAEWFFIMLDMMYQYYNGTHTKPIEVLGTHPPPHIRLRFLRHLFSSGSYQADIGGVLKGMANGIINELLDEIPYVPGLGEWDSLEQEMSRQYEDGLMLAASQKFAEARKLFLVLCGFYKESGNGRKLADCLRELGRVAELGGNYPEAVRRTIQSMAIYRSFDNIRGMASGCSHLKDIFKNHFTKDIGALSKKVGWEWGVEIKFENGKINNINLKPFDPEQVEKLIDF